MKTTLLVKNGIRAGFLYLFFLFRLLPDSYSQCIALTRSASAFTNDNSIGTIPFDNPGRAVSSNDSYADADALAVLFSGTTQYLKATGFGFNIPANSGICGLVIEIERSDGGFLSLGTGLRDHAVRLVVANAVTGNNLAAPGNWGTGDAYISYGNSTDELVWGETLTPAIVNSSNFGIAIAAKFNGIAALIPSADIDHIRMTLYYNPTLPTHIISFSSQLNKNNVRFDWKTAEEEDGEIITLQRKREDQHAWLDIARFDMHSGNSSKAYTYTDALTSNGNYSYRLRITNINSEYIFSETKHLSYNGKTGLSLYPNPAADFIIIENVKDPQSLVIRDLSMRSLSLPRQLTGNGTIRIDTRLLPPGVYFAGSGADCLKFLKR